MATITVTKGLIGTEDVSFMDGGETTGETFTRTTSTGGSQTIHKFSAKAIPLEDTGSNWLATNIEGILEDIKDATEGLHLKEVGLKGLGSNPTTDANQVKLFARDGSSVAEPWPHFIAESNGDVSRVLLGGASLKLWVYSNSAQEGWVIDTSVTDKILALKGGTEAYNTTGGSTAGTWTQPNHTHSISGAAHVHQWYEYTETGEDDKTFDNLGDLQNLTEGSKAGVGGVCLAPEGSSYTGSCVGDSYTSQEEPSITLGGSATANSWRPAAAVGTLQYPDVAV